MSEEKETPGPVGAEQGAGHKSTTMQKTHNAKTSNGQDENAAPGAIVLPFDRSSACGILASAGDPIDAGADIRPTIELRQNDVGRIVDKIEDALIASNLPLYQRGGKIVSPDWVKGKSRDNRTVESPGILEREEPALFEDVDSVAKYLKYDGRKKKLVPHDGPRDLIGVLQARRGRLRFPVLKALTSTPLIFTDGRVLDVPGYDEASGLLYDPRGVVFPRISDKPSEQDAIEALKIINAPFAEYPFDDDESRGERSFGRSRSVVLALAITAVVRAALPCAPAFGIDGNAPGVGKGKLISAVAAIATGCAVGVMKQGEKPEEFEKSLASAMLSGVSHIAIDNCTRPLDGDLLNQAITEETITIRLLGKNQNVKVSNSFLVTATGNGLILSGDLTRRWLIARIKTNDEQPELTQFSFNPVEYAVEHRVRIVTAVLTLLRAHHLANPKRPPCLGSFEDWSDTVRSALIWAGATDPVDSMERAKADDPKRNEAIRLMTQWAIHFGGEEATASGVVATVGRRVRFEPVHKEFHSLLMNIASKKGEIDSGSLGYWLRRYKDRWVNGMRFVATPDRNGVNIWRLEGAEAFVSADPALIAARKEVRAVESKITDAIDRANEAGI